MEKKKLVSRAEIKQFIKENDLKSVEDIQNVLNDLFAETLQEMLEAELDTTLGYEKNDVQNKRTSNRRNGHSTKTVRSEFGEIDIQIPRDR
jgi:putative transposase